MLKQFYQIYAKGNFTYFLCFCGAKSGYPFKTVCLNQGVCQATEDGSVPCAWWGFGVNDVGKIERLHKREMHGFRMKRQMGQLKLPKLIRERGKATKNIPHFTARNLDETQLGSASMARKFPSWHIHQYLRIWSQIKTFSCL